MRPEPLPQDGRKLAWPEGLPSGGSHAPAPLRRYGAAVASTAAALAVCLLLAPLLAPNYFIVFLGAVMVAAWYGGLGPGVAAGVVSVLLMAFFFLAPVYSLKVDAATDLLKLGMFVAVAYLASTLSETLRAARARAEEHAEEATRLALQLQEQAAELEAQADEMQSLNLELEEQIEESHLLRADLEAANAQLRAAAEEERRAMDALRESEARFRTLADHAPVLIWMAGTDGGCTFFNRPWLEFTGRPLEEELGNGWTERVHPDDHDRCLDVYRAAFRARRPFGMEYRLRRADGEYRWLLDSAVPLHTPEGEFTGFVGSCVDIHDRRLVEDRERFLLEAGSVLGSSLDYERTLEQVTRLAVPALADYCSVDVLTPAGEVRRVSTAHVDPAKEAVLRDVWERYPYSASDRVGVPEVLRTGEPALVPEVSDQASAAFARDPEHRRLLRDLGPRSYLCVPLVARGRVLGAISCVMSDSGRRYGEAELRVAQELARRAAAAMDNALLHAATAEASQAKSDFMAVMSHELRTPLNAIIGYTELFLLGIPTTLPDPLRPQVERIGSAARHLLGLIEEILTFSRLEANREEVRAEPLRASRAAEAAAALVEPLALERGLAFRVEPPARDVVLLTDPGKVQQVLANLLGNAVKFTDAGEVVLSVAEEDGEVLFAVRDTGVGITPADRERIFDPFWQVDQKTSRRAGGTGLGLSVARRLARLLGGDVTVESEPGRGSTFTLRLPAAPPPESP